MAFQSRFSRREPANPPVPKQFLPITRLELAGLDLSSPYDQVDKNRSPLAKNFRLYAEEGSDRKVSVSSRKGSGKYTDPLSEATTATRTSVTGAADQNIGVFTSWQADKFTASSTGPMTLIELNLKNATEATGPLVVEVFKDNSGVPGDKIAESGILGSDIDTTYDYVKVRFVEAPTITNAQVYWVLVRMQEDATGNYQISSTTEATTALTSSSGGLGWDSTTYSLNFKVYISSPAVIKGVTRFAPSSGNNVTLIAIGNNIYSVDDATGVMTSRISGLNANATEVNFAYADDKVFIVNGYDDLKTMNSSWTVETITNANLPKLRLITFHKTRLFGVSGNNRLIWSETPGNPSGASDQWYKAYLSTSFQEFPVANASEPITSIKEFQDNLYILTATGKYILYGDSPRNFVFREATGKKGAVSNRGIFVDENFIYFVANDGFYRFNGAKDDIISKLVQPEFDRIADLKKVSTTKWKRQVRFYYPSAGQATNDRCLLWHTVFEEWMLDTDAHVLMAIPLIDSDDGGELIEASSKSPTLFYGEVDHNNLGKAIDYQYNCVYDSVGNPAIRKRIVKFFPLLEGTSRDYTVSVGIDKDLIGNPIYDEYKLEVGGARVGDFLVGDGTKIGGETAYQPTRLRVSGYGYYWQVCTKHRGINNPVKFIGYVLSIRAKRL